MRLIIVSGLSGSGKSVALNMLEDLGYYCIDNLPVKLVDNVVANAKQSSDQSNQKIAVGIDARNRAEDLAGLPELIGDLKKSNLDCETLFIHADDGVLLNRYSETRRRHPLSNDATGLREAISLERKILAPVRNAADLVLDTSRTSVHQLREIVRQRIDQRDAGRMSLLFQSFGYKHGIPGDADYVFDVRCLPNPYWEPTLRDLTGLDQEVIEFLESEESVGRMLGEIGNLLQTWLPEFVRENRNYLTVAIGCTGGQHRSVYICENLASRFSNEYQSVLTRHNEITEDQTTA
ncbi:MAG: RNase adapter RapZ [Gammaproteobacteria bacterium]|nr:RNase adapter RapZ [Gammaproteobacteria bacterium]